MPPSTERGGHAAAVETLGRIAAALDAHIGDGNARRIDLVGLDAAALRVIDDALGEGEVVVDVAGDERTRIVEAVMAGVWKVQPLDGSGAAGAGWIEVAPCPARVRQALDAGTRNGLAIDLDSVDPSETMNALPVLAEVRSRLHAYRAGSPGHVVNIGRLPMTPADEALIGKALGEGPVRALCRGYGVSRVDSTACRNVWRVRHFNSDDKLLANVIEIADVPDIVAAPAEDVRDGAPALADAMEAYAR